MEISEEELKKKIEAAEKKAREGLLSQEEVDKVISKRLAEAKKKHDEELENEKKKAQMSAEELQKAEFDKLKAERDQFEKTLKQKEHHEAISKLMTERKIDSEFFDMFSGISDIETAKTSMDAFCDKMKSKIDTEVDSRIKVHVPSAGSDGGNPKEPDIIHHSFNQFK